VISAVRTLTAKDLKERLRDKSFILLGILTPLVLAFVLDLVFGDLDDGGLEVRMGVSNVDQTEISTDLQASILSLDGTGGIQISTLDPAIDPEAALDDDLDAVLVIPAGFADQLNSPGTAPTLTLIEDPDRPVQAGVAASIADGFVAEIERNRLLVAAGQQLGVTPDLHAVVDDLAVDRQFPGGEGLDTGARMLAGMAIMFVFFTVQFGVTTLLNEKESGTLPRLLAAPIPRDAIIASKGLVSFLLGVLATLILMAAGSVLMGAEWGPWFGVLLLVVAAVLTAVALMAIVAGIAKTAESAGGVQAIIAVALAMLGGSWFPVSSEGLIGLASRFTPHYWFLNGLEDLASSGSWDVVAVPVAMLVLIAVVAGVPAALLLRRRLVP
jgi:ABC-2 type transport system permease protein